MARTRGSKNLSIELKSKIIDLVRAGISPSYVSRFYNVSRNTVKGIIRRSKQVPTLTTVTKPSRKHKLGPRCVRRLLNYVKSNRQPLFVVAARFRTLDGTKLSERTIQRYLHKNGVRSYVAASKPYLTAKHIEARLNWCMERYQLTVHQWGMVAFTDESSFTLRPIRNHTRVWRNLKTRYLARNMMHTFKSGYVSLSVWGLFSARGRSPLVRIDGKMNQYKYIDTLTQYVLPFKQKYHSRMRDFIYQHDGCGPHRAKRVSAFLQDNGVQVLPYPAQSPDLNPIENVWSTMKRKLRDLHSYPSNPDALYEQLCDIWNKLPDTYFTTLISSMANRCNAIKNVRGSSSKY